VLKAERREYSGL